MVHSPWSMVHGLPLMCGIAGYILPPDQIPNGALERMGEALVHRGPDDGGEWGSRVKVQGSRVLRKASPTGTLHPSPFTLHPGYQIALAHRRLSIIDLSADGHQPMCNEDETVWITYNGEFYNFAEYREELEERGHVFKSNTDTEAIIHLYEEYGIDGTLERMNGMFAFGLWDERSGELFLVRDRLGQKPLYFAALEGSRFKGQGSRGGDLHPSPFTLHPIKSLVFASEIKALLASGLPVDTTADNDFLASFWTYGYPMGGDTVYEGVRQVEAGSYLRVKVEGSRGKGKGGQNHYSTESFLEIEEKKYWGMKFGSVLGPSSVVLGRGDGNQTIDHRPWTMDCEQSSQQRTKNEERRTETPPMREAHFPSKEVFLSRGDSQEESHTRGRRLEKPALTDKLEALLTDAIRLRLVADVPVGCFLSGGIDSTLIAALAKNNLGVDLETYTIAFTDEAYDESHYAKEIAEYLGLPNKVLTVDEDLAESFPEIARQFDEPFGDFSCIPTWFLCKLAREHTTVALTGDGGDELFGGYSHYLEGLGIWAASPWSLVLGPWSTKDNGLRTRLRQGNGGQAKDFRLKDYIARFYYRTLSVEKGTALRGRRVNGRLRRRLFTPEFAKDPCWKRAVERRAFCGREALPEGADVLQRMQGMDLHSYLLNDIHVKVDRMSMAHSLECRSPFMDHRVVEFALSLPPEAKIKNEGRGKQILRDLVQRHVPMEMIDRPKAGFTPPWEKWISGGAAHDLRQRWLKLEDPRCAADAGAFLFPDDKGSPVQSWNGFSYLAWKEERQNH